MCWLFLFISFREEKENIAGNLLHRCKDNTSELTLVFAPSALRTPFHATQGNPPMHTVRNTNNKNRLNFTIIKIMLEYPLANDLATRMYYTCALHHTSSSYHVTCTKTISNIKKNSHKNACGFPRSLKSISIQRILYCSFEFSRPASLQPFSNGLNKQKMFDVVCVMWKRTS